jgi:aconitate hydratase
MPHNLWNSLKEIDFGSGHKGKYYSLPQLEDQGIAKISRLPVSIRIVLESLLRNFDAKRVKEQDIQALAGWKPVAERTEEVPFVVARIILQDFTGVPLLVDLAAMRSEVQRENKNPKIIEPLVPVDLVVDHSVQVDFFGTPDAFRSNMEMEFKRNRARYEFLKWGMQAFDGFNVVPPGIGIVHQVNLEYLGKGVIEKDGIFYPDTLVGTDSHTTMINGLGIVGWGVGGIEAEAGMLGQPVYFLTPDVVGSQPPISCCIARKCCAKQKSSVNSWSSMAKAPPRCVSPTAPRSQTWRRNTELRWDIFLWMRKPAIT